ncbi:AAA family ATPase [Variovorax sp. PAMC 28711]|uniref:AAA family ATPase n=1 Tax=Variovorax sp. PAMC 28711 TaxID=1795631 RepID=UPI00078C0FBE|nr:AAA family ATPase [Variovorax sp. PAMC 28711]AMM24266.1 transcriptional regulator [Variovorax sp. PAMC 28711]
MTTLHGLVIGKFYPPHAGHQLLIGAAASQCARVTVIAMAASHESIPLALRVRWLRELHAALPNVVVTGIVDDIPIDYGNDAIWRAHVALMREALAAIDAPRVSAVFTSEPYGAELARHFDATPVTLDTARLLAPVSATRFRNDPPAYWDFIAAPVRSDLAWRIVVVGAESTGTTTLSIALAQALRERGGAYGHTRWVPEYGRALSVEKLAAAIAQAQLQGAPRPGPEDLLWPSDEFTRIATTQNAMAREQAAVGGPLLVCDTDAFATAIWHERYVGHRSPAVEAIAGQDRGRLYLLTHHDGVPFEDDGLRDGEALREWMTDRFATRLSETARRHVVLRGDRVERLDAALCAVDALLAGGWGFAAPLG